MVLTSVIRRETSPLKNGKHSDQQIGHLSWKCAIAMLVAEVVAVDEVEAVVRAHGMPVRQPVLLHLMVILMSRAQPNLTMREVKEVEGTDVDSAAELTARITADY